MAAEDGLPLYGLLPKHHMLDRAEKLAFESGLNPSSFWTFQDEDNMHVMMGIAMGCHGATVERAALEK
eukprot:6850022-Alexandrium_andersonii.AAC.1